MRKSVNLIRITANWVGLAKEFVISLFFSVAPKDVHIYHDTGNRKMLPINHRSEDTEGNAGAEVSSQKTQMCNQKPIVLDNQHLQKLLHQDQHSLIAPHKEIVQQYLAKMGGNYSVVSAGSRRLLQKVTG